MMRGGGACAVLLPQTKNCWEIARLMNWRSRCPGALHERYGALAPSRCPSIPVELPFPGL